jgi:hypothetical protein
MNGITWSRTPDKSTWCAAAGGLVLTVSKLTSGQWGATVDAPGVTDRSPQFGTRLAAQRWAQNRAGVTR